MDTPVRCSICTSVIHGAYMVCTQCKTLRICTACYLIDTVGHTCTGKIRIQTELIIK